MRVPVCEAKFPDVESLWRNLKRASLLRHDRVVINDAVGELKIAALDRLRLPAKRMSRPSTEIRSGRDALDEPTTLICNWTGRPTTVSELVRTAVTLGSAANSFSRETNHQATMMSACTKARRLSLRGNSDWLFIKCFARVPTSPYRHDARPCVHQVARVVLRLSSIATEARLVSRSSGLPCSAPPPLLVPLSCSESRRLRLLLRPSVFSGRRRGPESGFRLLQLPIRFLRLATVLARPRQPRLEWRILQVMAALLFDRIPA